MSSWRIIPKALAASNYSAAVDILSANITCANGWTQSQCRVEVAFATACFVSLITKGPLATVIGSAMLLPKTGSAALTANILYTLHHSMRNDRTYNYQISAAITTTNIVVDEIVEGQFYT